jgi:hypothetical protein
MMIHCRFRNKAVWDGYREAIRQGKTFQAVRGRSFQFFVRQLNGSEVPWTQREPPAECVLDDIEAGQVRKSVHGSRLDQGPEHRPSLWEMP